MQLEFSDGRDLACKNGEMCNVKLPIKNIFPQAFNANIGNLRWQYVMSVL